MKKFLTVLLTAVLFCVAAFLTITSVYRVSAVTLELSAVSEEAKEEAETLERALFDYYDERSIFSVNDSQAKKEFAKYPHFRLTGFKKSYPNRLVLYASEDAEVYAVEKEGGYFVLGADGTVLCERETPSNRSDGKPNVIVKGLALTAQKGEKPTDEYFLTVHAFASLLDERFGGIRSNLTEISLENTQYHPDDAILRLSMREGVTVVVYNPVNATAQKASNFLDFYADMKTAERMSGTVFVSDGGVCNYEP